MKKLKDVIADFEGFKENHDLSKDWIILDEGVRQLGQLIKFFEVFQKVPPSLEHSKTKKLEELAQVLPAVQDVILYFLKEIPDGEATISIDSHFLFDARKKILKHLSHDTSKLDDILDQVNELSSEIKREQERWVKGASPLRFTQASSPPRSQSVTDEKIEKVKDLKRSNTM